MKSKKFKYKVMKPIADIKYNRKIKPLTKFYQGEIIRINVQSKIIFCYITFLSIIPEPIEILILKNSMCDDTKAFNILKM